MSSWWQDVVTQIFNPPVEPGEDIGTPFHTPITALAGGTVVAETSGGFGERIDVRMANGQTAYYQHLDTENPALHVGSPVMPGEVLGLSGGQLHGGSHPNNLANSTGPHVEVGLYDAAGHPLNPTRFIAAGEEIGTGSQYGAASRGMPGSNPGGTPVTGLASADQVGSSGGGGLVNVNFPNPFAGLSGWITSTWSSATSEVAVLAIPLIIAGLIILVVLGSGDNKPAAAPAPQIVPIPV